MAHSLESILNDEPSVHTLPEGPESETPSTEPAETEVQPAEKPETEVSTKAPETGDDDDAELGPEPTDLSTAGLRKALDAERKLRKDERKRAREAERKLAEQEGYLRAHKERSTEKPRAEEQPKPEDLDAEFYKDPRGYADRVAEAKVKAALQESRQQNLRSQEAEMMEEHEDYLSAVQEFKAIASRDPAVAKAADQAWNLPRFAYNFVKKLHAQRANSEAELEKKFRAKYGIPEDGEAPAKPALPKPPQSIARARGTGAGTPARTGPRTLDEILA